MIKEAARLIAEARRPVIYAGGGILKSRAAEALRQLAELIDIPVVTTLMARGAFPDDHPLCLGMPGMHGNYTAITAMQQSDLLIALGTRFDDRVTGRVGQLRPRSQDHPRRHRPGRAGQDPPARTCRSSATAAGSSPSWSGALQPLEQPDRQEWRSRLSGWQERFPLHYDPPADGDALKPQYVMETLRDCAPEGTILASGVGQHQMWASQYWRFTEPYTWVNSGGLGTMGFCVPAAIGAKVGRPDRTVWAVDGDGCFQMTAQELVTASSERIPIKVAILNNAYLGMVRQWQEMFYEERYSEVYLSPDLPDYVKWAEAMGCVGVPGRGPRGGRADDREGQCHRRPARRHRLPHRRPGEGVPDGAGRGVQRRRGRPSVRSSPAEKGWCSDGCQPHSIRPSPCWSRTDPACWPG